MVRQVQISRNGCPELAAIGQFLVMWLWRGLRPRHTVFTLVFPPIFLYQLWSFVWVFFKANVERKCQL
jgi:hypothetical protein